MSAEEQQKPQALAKDTETFYVDAVLFDMDGTLVDSISAVEGERASLSPAASSFFAQHAD